MRNNAPLNPASQAMSGQEVCAASFRRASVLSDEWNELDKENGFG